MQQSRNRNRDSRPRTRTGRSPFFEALEFRRYLAHSHGFEAGAVLTIIGSAEADEIRLEWDQARNQINVEIAGQGVRSYPGSDWKRVVIEAGAGDDRIHLDPGLAVPVQVFGGDGYDTLIGLLPSDELSEDVVFTNGEHRELQNLSCHSVECLRRAEGEPREPQTGHHLSPELPEFNFAPGLHLGMGSPNHVHVTASYDGGDFSTQHATTHATLETASPLGPRQASRYQTNIRGSAAHASHDWAHGGNSALGLSSGRSSESPRTRTESASSAATLGGKRVCLTNGSQIATRIEGLASATTDLAPKKPGCT
jgi:hypothetical protein